MYHCTHDCTTEWYGEIFSRLTGSNVEGIVMILEVTYHTSTCIFNGVEDDDDVSYTVLADVSYSSRNSR